MQQLRLAYLDGLRAVAALYVVMFHAVLGFAREQHGAWRALRVAFCFGHEAVAIFIVLSGYCLMLPVARRGESRLEAGFGRYIGRRAFRILPPYFAALALSLLLIASCTSLRRASGTIWDDSLPAFEPGSLISHFLLLHNWVPAWAHRINGPLWSVASEWQIYFFFPLFLLPLRRRLGWVAMLLAALALGYAPLAFGLPGAHTANPWYLALFSLGMLAAEVSFGNARRERMLRARIDFRMLTRGVWLVCALCATVGARIWFRFIPVTDLAIGFATSLLLVDCTERATRNQPGLVLRVLESRAAGTIGHFSYSLYLTHLPVVALCFFALSDAGVSSQTWLAPLLLLSSVPASLGVAYLFHLAAERPFMLSRSAGRAQPAQP